MIPRTLFGPEHNEFRRNVRRFIEEEIVPFHESWEDRQCVDRTIWN
ncbi:MAG: acyl-CoA dehydrogenase family protein, partial [Burkholderiales bacterium]